MGTSLQKMLERRSGSEPKGSSALPAFGVIVCFLMPVWQGCAQVGKPDNKENIMIEAPMNIRSSQSSRIVWKRPSGHTLLVAPLVYKDIVVGIGLGQGPQDKLGYLHAWDRATGNERWTFAGRDGTGLPGGVLGTPVFFADALLLATGNGQVISLNPQNGRINWENTFQGRVVSAPTTAFNQLIVAGLSGLCTAYDIESGHKTWDFQTQDMIWAAPVIYDQSIMVGSWDGSVYAINAVGDQIWTTDLSPSEPNRLLALNQYLLLFDSGSGELKAIQNSRSGPEVQWNYRAKNRKEALLLGFGHSVCLADNGDGSLSCIDLENGNTIWRVPQIEDKMLQPLIKENQLIIASTNGYITAYDLSSGSVQWKDDTGLTFSSAPEIWDNTLYIGGSDGTFYAIALN